MNVRNLAPELSQMKKILGVLTPYQCQFPTLAYERPYLSTALDYERFEPIPYERLATVEPYSRNPPLVMDYMYSRFKGMRYLVENSRAGTSAYAWIVPANQAIITDAHAGPINRIAAISIKTSCWNYIEVAPQYRRKGYAHMMLKAFPGTYTAHVSTMDPVGFYLMMMHCFVPVERVLGPGDGAYLVMQYNGFEPVQSLMSDLAFVLRGHHTWALNVTSEEWENMMDRLLAFYGKYGPDIPTPPLANTLTLRSTFFDDLNPIELQREGNYSFSYLERWSTPIWWPYSLEKWKRFYDRHFAKTIAGEPQFFLKDYTEKPNWFSGTDLQWFAIAARIAEMHDDILADIQARPQYM